VQIHYVCQTTKYKFQSVSHGRLSYQMSPPSIFAVSGICKWLFAGGGCGDVGMLAVEACLTTHTTIHAA